MIDTFRDIQQLLLNDLNVHTKRFLYHELDLEPRLVGIVGPRGVGKTTLLLQLIRDYPSAKGKPFYVSADHIYFSDNRLFDLVKELYLAEGVNRIFIDEIHKYTGWNQELKNIYDAFPRLHVVFSGSSSLNLVKGAYDLSRRALLFHLPGLSFREYLNFHLGTDFQALSLDSIIGNSNLTRDIAAVRALIGHFRSYLATGYYPFSLTDTAHFYQRLQRVIDKTIYEDIANFYRLKTEHLHYFKKLLYYLATIPPGEINTHSLAKSLRIDDKTVQNYVQMMMDTGLARGLGAHQSGHKLIRKPAKLYLDNPTMQHALCHELGKEVKVGTVRELFFLNTLVNSGEKPAYNAHGSGDFTVRNTIFEIGGRSKGRHQLTESAGNSFVVKDDILTGSSKTLPLYLFGFLY